MSEKTYSNIINNVLKPSSSGQYFQKFNPAKPSESLGKFPQSNAQDLEQALEAAKQAFEIWKNTPAPKRAEVLYKAAEITS